MAKKYHWGIMGTGSIARLFAQGLAGLGDAELTAVSSRTEDKARSFANDFGVPNCYGSYAELASATDVDIVYIATIHPCHMDNTLLCINNSKAVLCEKPFAMNVLQAEQMIAAAKGKEVFLMEAMWMRFLPIMAEVRKILAEGLIGDIRMVIADFGFRGNWEPNSRLLNLKLGGGSILDVGVYTISFASMVLGEVPGEVTGLAHLGETGVDEQSAMVLGYDQGKLAVLSCAIRTKTPQQALIIGTKGTIKIHPPFFCPTTATISVAGMEERVINMAFDGNGYNYEAEEVMQCLRQGRLQSDIMPLSETLAIMQTIDRLRKQWGLKYPDEQFN